MIRTVLIVIGVVLVLAIGAAVIVPSLIPAEVYRAQIQARATEALGRPVEIAGPVSVAVFPSIQARAADVAIANAEGFSSDPFAQVEELRARLALLPLLSRRVEIREFVLMQPAITLEVDGEGRNNWTFAQSAEAAAPTSSGELRRRPGALPFDAALGDVRVVEGGARYIDAAAGAEHALTNLNVALSMPGLGQPLAVDADFLLDGDAVTFSGSLDSLRSFFDGNVSPFTADLNAGALLLTLDGQFEAGEAIAFSGDVRLASEDIKALAATAGAELPPGDIYRRFDVRGRASGDASRVAFEDATIELDDIRATGGFVADVSGAKPTLSGALVAGDLDVTPYMQQGSGAPPSGGGGGVPPWSEEPIDLSALNTVDADFTVEAQSIKAGDLAFGRSVMTAALEDGRLQIDIQELNVYEGTGAAQLVVDAGPATPTFALSADLANLQAQPFLAAAAKFDRLIGAGNGRLNLTAAGGSQAAIMRSLDGTGGFDFKDGAIQGINIAAALRGLDEALQGNFSLDAFQSTATTDFTDLLGQFTIADGVATLSDFRLSSPLVRVTGSGTLDIAEQSVDLRLEPRAVASAQGQGGATDLSGIGIPLRLSGSWGGVTPGIDQDALQRLIAQQAAGAVGGDVGRVLDDALGDDAGGLLRGALGLPGRAPEQPPADGATPAPDAAPSADAAPAEDEEDEDDPAERLLRGVFGNQD